MKYLIAALLFITITGEDRVAVNSPEWLTDSQIKKVLKGANAFDDNITDVIAIEFWAAFNEENEFKEWDLLEGVSYYRADISKCPLAKKDYRIRMAPTIILFVDGSKEVTFKAGLDLVLPANLADIQESINELKKASQF